MVGLAMGYVEIDGGDFSSGFAEIDGGGFSNGLC